MIAILFRTLIIYILLCVAMRWMGKRQIGELELSELIFTLLISEIAALPIGDPDLPLLNAILPGCFLVSAEVLIAGWKQKSQKLESTLDGDPVYLIYKGRILQRKLEENRISIGELLSEIRQKGIGDIREIDYCILESNGKVSILEKQDRGHGGIAHVLVADGVLQKENLDALGLDPERIGKACGPGGEKSVFLLTIDDDGKINRIEKEKGSE